MSSQRYRITWSGDFQMAVQMPDEAHLSDDEFWRRRDGSPNAYWAKHGGCPGVDPCGICRAIIMAAYKKCNVCNTPICTKCGTPDVVKKCNQC